MPAQNRDGEFLVSAGLAKSVWPERVRVLIEIGYFEIGKREELDGHRR